MVGVVVDDGSPMEFPLILEAAVCSVELGKALPDLFFAQAHAVSDRQDGEGIADVMASRHMQPDQRKGLLAKMGNETGTAEVIIADLAGIPVAAVVETIGLYIGFDVGDQTASH